MLYDTELLSLPAPPSSITLGLIIKFNAGTFNSKKSVSNCAFSSGYFITPVLGTSLSHDQLYEK